MSEQRIRARIELAPQTLIGRVTITLVGAETESVEGQAEHAAALYDHPFVPVEFHAQVVEQLGETLKYANVIDAKPLFDKITASVLAMYARLCTGTRAERKQEQQQTERVDRACGRVGNETREVS